MKLNKAQITKELPKEVSEVVLDWQERHHSRYCEFRQMAGRELYISEGCRYTFVRGDSQVSMKTGSEMSGYIEPESMFIGKRYPVPPGTWVIETEYFLGKPILTVMHWGVAQIAH